MGVIWIKNSIFWKSWQVLLVTAHFFPPLEGGLLENNTYFKLHQVREQIEMSQNYKNVCSLLVKMASEKVSFGIKIQCLWKNGGF